MNVGACTFLRELTIIGSLSINLLNNFTENKQGKEIPENSNPMSSEPVQICWSSQSIIFVSLCNTIFESESGYSFSFGHTLKYPSIGSQYLKSTAHHSFLKNCWEQWIFEYWKYVVHGHEFWFWEEEHWFWIIFASLRLLLDLDWSCCRGGQIHPTRLKSPENCWNIKRKLFWICETLNEPSWWTLLWGPNIAQQKEAHYILWNYFWPIFAGAGVICAHIETLLWTGKLIISVGRITLDESRYIC